MKLSMKKLLGIVLLLAAPVFAGQSLLLSGTQSVENTSVAAQGANSNCRMEFQIHDWDASPVNGQLNDLNACGFEISINNGDRIQVVPQRTTGWPCCAQVHILLSLFGVERWAVVRAQLVPSGAGGKFILEAWDIRGARVYSSIVDYSGTSGTNANGATVNVTGGEALQHGFFRAFTSVVPANARPPLFSDTGDLVEWKFEGNLNDSSGHSYHGTLSSGSPAYAGTPGQTLVRARPKTANAPSWDEWKAARAGFPLQLDGSQSFSWGDSSASISCLWQTVNRPTGAALPVFNNRNSCTPTLNGMVFGPYTFRLTVTTSDGPATADLAMGAVTYDNNGVVIPASPAVSEIFGPMVAYGQNPWNFADERHMTASRLRGEKYAEESAYSSYTYGSNPAWDNAQTGTVSYTINGKGLDVGATCTTLSTGIDAITLTIPVTNASCLDLANLPTRVFITSGSALEEIRICATTGTTGAQTLTACYDGRGVDDYSAGTSIATAVLGAQAWSSGAVLGQNLVKGSGTSFLTTLAPGGAGPVGPVKYSSGTVELTAGSVTMTGSGTAWVTGAGTTPGLQVGDAVRVVATHSATEFVFAAFVQSVDSTTTITLNRAFPLDADTASGLTYKIIQPWTRRIVAQFTRPSPYTGTALTEMGGTGCESDTQCFFNPSLPGGGRDVAGLNGQSFSARPYSFDDSGEAGKVYIANFGLGSIDFYGEAMANYALYFRSGSREAHERAHTIVDHWINHPSLSGGLGGYPNSPLTLGGGVIGAIVCLVADAADCPHAWEDVVPWIQKGADAASITTCLDWDTRESAYPHAWLALGALYDPDGTRKAAWRTALQAQYTRDGICKRSNNSFDNSYFYNQAGPLVTLTSGSAAGTGTGFSSSDFLGQDIVAVSVTSGSAAIVALSGTFNAAATSIALSGTIDGNPFHGFYQMTRTDATHATLSVLWPGATNSAPGVPGMTTNENMGLYSQAALVFGQSATDTADLSSQYIGKFNSPTSITLDRSWGGDSAAHFAYRANAAGFGQQDFMVGIKDLPLRLSALLDTPLSTNFAAIRSDTAAYLYSRHDSDTLGIPYCSFGFSKVNPVASGVFNWKVPGCILGTEVNSLKAARALNGEISGSLFSYANGQNFSAPSVAYGDAVYGSIWGRCGLTAPGYPCDANYVSEETNDASMRNDGKWLGFFFGVGMAHQWPAARVDGVQAPQNRTVHIGDVQLGAANLVRAIVTSPSGVETTFVCTTADCPIQVDDRQGLHWYKVQYLSASLQLLRETPPVLLNAPPVVN